MPLVFRGQARSYGEGVMGHARVGAALAAKECEGSHDGLFFASKPAPTTEAEYSTDA